MSAPLDPTQRQKIMEQVNFQMEMAKLKQLLEVRGMNTLILTYYKF